MKLRNTYDRVKEFMGSRHLFVGVLILFTTQALWVASTAAFPLPFDELYHFTLIQNYSHAFSPIIVTQPSELAVAGDITRLASYLSHYLLSFPLRATQLLTDDVAMQVLVLRFINIAFVVGALVLFRYFLIRLTKSGMLSNGAIALFCILPVTSLLAAHINYDNLLLLIFAALLVLAQSILTLLNEKRELALSHVLVFGSVCLLGCLVKITFIPIAVVAVATVGTVLIRKGAWKWVGVSRSGRAAYGLIGASLLLIASTGLFIERIGVNLATYGSAQPDCSAVQPVNVCSQYGPWARNHGLEQAAATDTSFEGSSVEGYVTNIWVPLMIRGLGGVDSSGIVPEIPKPVLIGLIGITAVLFAGMIAMLLRRKDLTLVMVGIAIIVYMIALLQRNYSEFMNLHEIVAVQGRYIVPFIIPVVAIGMWGIATHGRILVGLGRNVNERAKTLGDLDPDEAYERSARYWSAKTWRRRSTEG